MDSIDIVNEKNKKTGSVSLPAVVAEKVNKAVLYQAVKTFLAGKHHGTVDTKTRAEVNRTSKKVYKQKGTGGARHGSRKSSPFVGGGRVFGPHPRSFALDLPKKVKKLAVAEAIKWDLTSGRVTVVESIPLTKIKTKDAQKYFSGLGVNSALVVLDAKSDVLSKSIRNLKDFKVSSVDQINVFDLLKYSRIVFTKPAFEQVKERFFA